jgi:hypothetical protein
MKMITKFTKLCAAVAVLGLFMTDISAMYGKMSGGISYTAAQTGNVAAQQKVAEAHALAVKINTLRPGALNNLPSGMTADEFIYELLNWPANVKDVSHNVRISDSLRTAIMAIDALNTQEKRITFSKLAGKLSVGRNLLFKAKISDQKITKEAVTAVLIELAAIDKLAAERLHKLRKGIAAVEIEAILLPREERPDPVEKFRRKIAVIERYIPQFSELYARVKAINLPAIIEEKHLAVHQADVHNSQTTGVDRADPLDVRLIEPGSRTMAATVRGIDAKRLLTEAIVAQLASLADQLRLLDEFHQLNDTAFADVWVHLADVAITVAATSEGAETPYDTFLATGLLKLAAKRDRNLQDRLFAALPDDVKQPTGAPGITDPALDNEYLIPDPRVVDWSVDR